MNRGLIEAYRPAGAWHPRERLPRFMNRGLIEALRAGLGAARGRRLPRFMNRGLIEAGAGLIEAQWRHNTSPIHESGPH